MKRHFAMFAMSLLISALASNLSAQSHQTILRGRVLDQQGANLEYASVVLISQADSSSVFGGTTDQAGLFSIQAPGGEYQFRCEMLGFQHLVQSLSLVEEQDLGDLILEPSDLELDRVEVYGRFIRRESDRFVVNVAGSAMAIGKTLKEMLKISPGVWVDERSGISINGKSNPKVMINDRLVRETGEELIAYLETIKAEDIKSIEIISMAGVEYDANAQGGVISITLKRQRQNGIEGSASMRLGKSIQRRLGDDQYTQSSLTFNYMRNAFRFYTTLSEMYGHKDASLEMKTKLTGSDSFISTQKIHSEMDFPTVRLGSVYDIDEKHSVGVEANLRNMFPTTTAVNGMKDRWLEGTQYLLNTTQESRRRSPSANLSANYIAQLDDRNSTFKLLLDYYRAQNENNNHYTHNYTGGLFKDSVYRSLSNSRSDIYAVTGDFDLKSAKGTRIMTGFKYNYQDVSNVNLYDYDQSGAWIPMLSHNYTNGYTENVAALYGKYSTMFKKLSLSLGVRGEYTYAVPTYVGILGIDKQNYFSFFPNANLTIPLGKAAKTMLVFAYNRKIMRPNYNQLIPSRVEVGANTFSEGNPKLKPSFSNDCSISFVLAQRYNLTAGAQLVQQAITHVVIADPLDGVLVQRPENLATNRLFYMNLNLPVQPLPWWKIQSDFTAIRIENKVFATNSQLTNNSFMGSINNSFTLFKNFTCSLDGRYTSSMLWSNFRVSNQYSVSTGVQYAFAQKKWTAGLYINDLFYQGKLQLKSADPGTDIYLGQQFQYRRLGLSLRYNFKAGKSFKVKHVETGVTNQGENAGGLMQ